MRLPILQEAVWCSDSRDWSESDLGEIFSVVMWWQGCAPACLPLQDNQRATEDASFGQQSMTNGHTEHSALPLSYYTTPPELFSRSEKGGGT